MLSTNQPIREIVARQASAGAVLDRFDIDICARGAETLAQACARLQLSVEQVLEHLEQADLRERGSSVPDFKSYSLTRLIQYVVRVHHRYIREQLPQLIALARKVAGVHGRRDPELLRVLDLLEQLRTEMLDHFESEEQCLFPWIAQLDEDAPLASPAPPESISMQETVFVMAQEHAHVAHLLDQLQHETNEFAAPDWACGSYLSLLAGLRDFKRDLERHLEIEDGMLFPRALEVEMAARARR
jgi:regulator of cell morphogenesis and NO signaling